MPGWLIGFDIIENDLSKPVLFKGIAPDGRHVSARLIARINGQMSLTPLARKISMVDKAADGMTNYIAMGDNARSAILRIGTMEDEKPKSFSEFTSEVSQILPQESVRRLIIDLRDNGGGDNMLAEPLRRILIKSRFNRPGGIYVLISPGTFSAAMNFATRLERETDAIFVGEPTGSSPNHYGDAVLKKAPLSGTPYLISTERWQDSSPFDHREWILPDLPALPTFDDYVNGRDAALNKALTDEPGPMSEADWRLRVMRPWERNSQKVKWTLFYE